MRTSDTRETERRFLNEVNELEVETKLKVHICDLHPTKSRENVPFA